MGEIADVEEQLIGIKYETESIKSVLETIDLDKYFGNVTVDELIELIY